MAETGPSSRRGDPNVAVLLTLFLPGAGHLYLGRVAAGVLVFAVIEGLYLAGWLLTEGRTFEYLDLELRGPFSTLLAPEAGNLGAMFLHLKRSGFGATDPVPFPAWMVLGSCLTAVSGVFNLFAASHAHLEARRADVPAPKPHPVAFLLAAWILPGLGHWLQGRRKRGAIVFALLVGLFVVGTWLSAGTNLSRERHFYYWAGQFLLGGPALLAEAVVGHPPVERDLPWVDVGLLYACLAGLLNVLAMLDVFGVAERRWLGSAGPAPAGNEAVAT